MVILKNILVATDLGEAAAVALAYGRDLARHYGSSLHLLMVTDDMAARYATDLPAFNPMEQAALDEGTRSRLEQELTAEDREQLKARAVVRFSTSPAQAITEYADEQHIDLIITGTHGRGAVGHLLMGNVAEHVVRTAPCPVLTVRHPQREFIAPDALATVSGS